METDTTNSNDKQSDNFFIFLTIFALLPLNYQLLAVNMFAVFAVAVNVFPNTLDIGIMVGVSVLGTICYLCDFPKVALNLFVFVWVGMIVTLVIT